jgi:hypothetical protein
VPALGLASRASAPALRSACRRAPPLKSWSSPACGASSALPPACGAAGWRRSAW